MPMFNTDAGWVDAPNLDAARKWSEKQKGSAAPPAAGKPGGEGKEQPGFFSRMWTGLTTGEDASKAGLLGAGLADPAVGMAQMGARAPISPEGMPLFMSEEQQKAFTPDTKAVDTAVQQREQRIQEGAKKAGTDSFFGGMWARTLGNIVSPVTLATTAVPGGAAMRTLGTGGRLGMAALGGAVQGLQQPAVSGSFGPEKLIQAAEGAAGGVVGGYVGEKVGSGIAAAMASGSAEQMDRQLVSQFRRVIGPGIRGKKTAGAIASENNNIVTAVDEVIQRRRAQGRDPIVSSPLEFADELSADRKQIFDEYHAKMQAAGEGRMDAPNPHVVPAFRQSGQATQQAANAVSDAQNALTMARAQQARAGNNVYMAGQANASVRVAQQRLAQATQRANALQLRHQQITHQMYQPFVDLAPIADALENRINTVLRVHAPGVADRAEQYVARLRQAKSYTLAQAEEAIADVNKQLNAFYRNPNPAEASFAGFNAESAGMLRRALDQVVEALDGPGYQNLKNRYGALKAVEESVVNAYNREARKLPGGIGGIFADLNAVVHGAKAVFSFDPHQLATALGSVAAKKYLERLRDPNVAIAHLFRKRAQGVLQPPMGPREAAIANAMRAGTMTAAGATTGSALGTRYRPLGTERPRVRPRPGGVGVEGLSVLPPPSVR